MYKEERKINLSRRKTFKNKINTINQAKLRKIINSYRPVQNSML